MSTPTLLVCGLGRCGSSLLMQMLYKGGFPTVGEWPAFEPEYLSPGADFREVLKRGRGKASKALDPHRMRYMPDDGVPGLSVIFLHRDSEEQAKSQVKFLRQVVGVSVSSNSWREIAKSLNRESILATDTFLDREIPVAFIAFEDVLATPRNVAEHIEQFLSYPLDIASMCAAVRQRSAKCAPDMAMELSLMQQGGSLL